ncbi:hypothetical protein Aab01nite_48530 [Paractinoplanes abujensis]|nr:hypothetical protein Aab01nite_48530 [Actinoplanes abujensis]
MQLPSVKGLRDPAPLLSLRRLEHLRLYPPLNRKLIGLLADLPRLNTLGLSRIRPPDDLDGIAAAQPGLQRLELMELRLADQRREASGLHPSQPALSGQYRNHLPGPAGLRHRPAGNVAELSLGP